MKTILLTGIGGLTPRSIARVIKKNHPDYKLIGCDIDKRAIGFFMKDENGNKLIDNYYVVPPCKDKDYFPLIEKIVRDEKVDYAFIEPESEIVEWGDYFEKNGKYPCPTMMGSKVLSVSLKDKSIMAELLEGTEFIPKTIKVTQDNPRIEDVEKEIGFPCWIRATEGTGGLGSLCLKNIDNYKAWLAINFKIDEFTVSEYLSGRHLANQMFYYNGEYVKGASLECAEYVMAKSAPSRVTGNTHLGRFLNEDRICDFCNRCIEYLEEKLGVKAHGVLSFDLKEDGKGNLKVTEINIRHMAYTGVMAEVGFDLIEDTIRIMEDGHSDNVQRAQHYHYDKPYVFLRDVDIEPMVFDSEDVFNK